MRIDTKLLSRNIQKIYSSPQLISVIILSTSILQSRTRSENNVNSRFITENEENEEVKVIFQQRVITKSDVCIKIAMKHRRHIIL